MRFDWRDDRGQAGGAEVVSFGLLVFVAGSLLIANAWAVVDAKLATDTAAREATRAFVEHDTASGDPRGAFSRAVDAGLAVLEAQGMTAAADVRLVSPLPDGYVRCARVTFEAAVRVPAVRVPFIGGFGEGVRVRSVHSELIDPFRDGVPGEARC